MQHDATMMPRRLRTPGWHIGISRGLAASSIVIAATAVTPATASDVGVAPHRAIYEISLARTSANANVTDLSGRMVYELTGSRCTGFKQTMRFVTRTSDNRGQPTVSDMRSSFKENGDSDLFEFESENFRNERRTDRTLGSAKKSGRAIDLKLQRPSRRSKTIEGPVMFPVAHSLAILKAANAGDKVFTATVFDGSEKGDKVFETTAAIGQRLEPGYNGELPRKGDFPVLDSERAWPVSLSYFERSEKRADNVPSYELAFVFFENGVSRRLFIDYGAFAIRGALSKLEMLDTKPCP
ncbi:MAG: cell envelope integrity EipB family protein [Pseudomonadota bacterium]